MSDHFYLNENQSLGIPIALLGAIFLSLGAQFQHRGVAKVQKNFGDVSTPGLNGGHLVRLLARPSWVLGTFLLGCAIILQLLSLKFSTLIVVQPLGVVALVFTAVINARISGVPLNKKSIIAVVMCVFGVGLFVTIAVFSAVDVPIQLDKLFIILALLAVVLGGCFSAYKFFRHKLSAFSYIVGAGILYGFVATLAKVVISRIQQQDFEFVTLCCILALLLAAILGAVFVQNAYSSGPPDLVIAGLTVIDPLVAIGIGILVLQEASQASLFAVCGFVFCGIVAISGVFFLAKYHPQISK